MTRRTLLALVFIATAGWPTLLGAQSAPRPTAGVHVYEGPT